jgi:hypothetical protein
MPPEDDWRLHGEHDEWLRGATFVWRAFAPRKAVSWTADGEIADEVWDHEHCYFCWATFGDGDEEGELAAAWTTAERAPPADPQKPELTPRPGFRLAAPSEPGYEWVCSQCFEDFRVRFEWSVRDADD